MRRLSRNDLETVASKIVRAYMRLPELQGITIQRIDPELFAENLLHLNVEYTQLSRSGTVLGLTTFEPLSLRTPTGIHELDGETVLIESFLNEDGNMVGRRNFTIMHEACHHALKKLFPEDYGRKPHENGPVQIHCCRAEPSRREKITDWEEWQTNTLASASFLPWVLVQQAMEKVGLQGKIRCLNSVFFPAEFEKFAGMAEILGCSKQALSIRMRQFGLIGESYLGDPYRMVEVEVD